MMLHACESFLPFRACAFTTNCCRRYWRWESPLELDYSNWTYVRREAIQRTSMARSSNGVAIIRQHVIFALHR